jgi:hypothetical protein
MNMLKIIISALLCLSLSNFIAMNVQAEQSLKGLSKNDFLKAYEEKMEDAWDAMSTLYGRVDPELKDMVPGKVWTNEDRVANACIYDKMKASGELDNYIASLDKLDEMRDIILENDDMTMLNMQDYPELENNNVANVGGYLEAMQSCGYMDLMQKRMQESGLWAKMMQSAAADSENN